MIAAVDSTLSAIGADEIPLELVLNKADRIDLLRRRRLSNRYPDALLVSALSGQGLDELRERVKERFSDRWESVRLLIPYDEGGKLNELYALGAPIDEREDTPDGVLVVARLPRRELVRYGKYLIADARDAPAASHR
jgi:GTP-binding protein HflX